ncbi:MAG: transcription elongation factor GreA [Patescibacteria group bacterium]
MSEYLSAEALVKLKQEVHTLKTVKRRDIAARLEHAKSLGDLSENAEYQEAIEEQKLVEQRIAEWEERVREAVVMEKPTRTDCVAVGSTVRVTINGKEAIYTIVGSEEANPAAGKVSNESPLGKAFLGKKVGETAEVKAPAGVMMYTVVEIK